MERKLTAGNVIPIRITNATGEKQRVRLFHNDCIPDGVSVKPRFAGVSYTDIKNRFLIDQLVLERIRFDRSKSFYRKAVTLQFQKVDVFGTISGVKNVLRVRKGQYIKTAVELACDFLMDGFSSLTFEVDSGITDIYLLFKK